MKQRSSHNWKTKSGGWDVLNTQLIDFYEDYPILSSLLEDIDFQIVANCNDYKKINNNTLVSSFLDDYILERYWNNPLKYVELFKKAKYVMSPDYSLFLGMPKPMQMWNIYRNRLIGYIWQKNAIKVIPTISWSDENSFDFCFNGVDVGSVVAVSNVGCRSEEQKYYFDFGFKEMIKRIKPHKIIFQCNKKYKENYRNNDIIFIDSFWESKRKLIKSN